MLLEDVEGGKCAKLFYRAHTSSFLLPTFSRKKVVRRERTKRFATTLPGNCARDFRE